MKETEDGEEFATAAWFVLPEDGPNDPRPIVHRLVDELEEFADLRIGEALIMVVMRSIPASDGGKAVAGSMALPTWKGKYGMGDLALWLLAKACGGEPPDFILLLDTTFWEGATPHQREALVHHELMHAKHATDRDGEKRFTEEGLPVWAIRPHDLEEFNQTVQRYGAWHDDITSFVGALRDGGAIN